MTHIAHDIGVASQIGSYSDGIETASGLRWLHTAGTPGLGPQRDLPPDIEGQAELAWKHILTLLERANMGVEDLVKVTQYLTRAEDIPAYVKIRKRVLGEVKPAFMLLVVPALIWPEVLLEIEIIAAKA